MMDYLEFEDEMLCVLRDAYRYRWLRENPAWETEAFLSDLTPEEFDKSVDKELRKEELKVYGR